MVRTAPRPGSTIAERRYPLREAAEAIRHVERGHARGKVVITV